MTVRTVSPVPVAERARLRIMRRILPYLFLLYIIAYLDRTNVGMAALEMSKALGFTAEVFGFGAGIFFFGYFLLEIPGALIIEKWSARGWIARIMISWGLVAIGMGFIHTAMQFYVMRFLLGAAEAGFFPGIIVYLSHWFRSGDRAKTIALFMAASPISFIIGAPISGLLLGINWLHMEGWRWLFILEGAPAVIFGIVTIFYLTDRPHQARWLEEDEREWIDAELEKEKLLKLEKHSWRIWEAFKSREVILLTGAYFLLNTSAYGLHFWLPTLIKTLSGSSNVIVGLITILPYCFYLISILLIGWSSDRTGERRWHTVLPMLAAGAGFFLSAVLHDHTVFTVAFFCLAAAGIGGSLPGFWSLPTSFLSGTTAAAAIGLINSVGNLGGFVGPYVVGRLNTITGSFFGGVVYLSLSIVVGACLIFALRPSKVEKAC